MRNLFLLIRILGFAYVHKWCQITYEYKKWQKKYPLMRHKDSQDNPNTLKDVTDKDLYPFFSLRDDIWLEIKLELADKTSFY